MGPACAVDAVNTLRRPRGGIAYVARWGRRWYAGTPYWLVRIDGEPPIGAGYFDIRRRTLQPVERPNPMSVQSTLAIAHSDSTEPVAARREGQQVDGIPPRRPVVELRDAAGRRRWFDAGFLGAVEGLLGPPTHLTYRDGYAAAWADERHVYGLVMGLRKPKVTDTTRSRKVAA